MPQPDDPRYGDGSLFDIEWLSEDDPLQHWIMRLNVDGETGELTLKGTMRFENGKEGPARLEEGMKAGIEAVKLQLFYPLLKDLFAKVVWKRDGVDLHVSLKLAEKDFGMVFGGAGLLPYLMLAPMRVAAPAQVKIEVKGLKPAKQAKPVKPPKKQGEVKKGRQRAS